jgi:DNA-binding LytR/AlgR family response regulator
MKLNCIIVDDSSVQRIIISKLVSNHVSLNLVAEFTNASEAKKYMSTNDIDLLFLDIEMPGVSGFDLLDGLTEKPQVIFISSKSDYALKAFDYDATDYIQKPITSTRFEAAIKRALNLYELMIEKQDEDVEHIFIKSKLKKIKIALADVKWVEAFGDYIKVVTDTESHLVLSTMKAFKEELPKNKFVRVHKSFIVNIDKVERFNSKFAEIGVSKIPLSRDKKNDLRDALENN